MKPVKTAAEQSTPWKFWHSLNYLIGGFTFVIGSVLMFPNIDDTHIINQVSIWFYVIGSFTLLLADMTELVHHLHDWRTYIMVVISTLNSVSTYLYFVGSVLLPPSINMFMAGMDLFIVGSFLLTAAQVWKIVEVFKLEGNTWK